MEKSKINKIKETIIESGLNSTTHGPPHILKSKRLMTKLMWYVCTLISTVACSYLMIKTILTFINFDHVTNLENVFEQPTQFFTIQFCSKDARSFNNKSLNKDLLKQCVFNYDSACLIQPQNFFESYIDPTYNQCFRFNSGKNMSSQAIQILNSTIGGKDDSLIMEIFAPSGLVFWIHNYTTPPRRQYKNNHNGDIQFASAGWETQVVIDRTFEYKLDYPYSNCLKDPRTFQRNMTIINFMIKNNVPYSQVNCLELCFDMQYLIDNPCNCTNASLGNIWDNCYGRLNQISNYSSCTLNYKTSWYKQKLDENYADLNVIQCRIRFQPEHFQMFIALTIAIFRPIITN